jgi:hypothetical protein
MLNKKQIQARISAGLAEETAEDTLRRTNAVNGLAYTVVLVEKALKTADITAAGWWHNTCGNGCNISYNLRISSMLPGQDIEICIRKSPTTGDICTDVRRVSDTKKTERTFFLNRQEKTEQVCTQEIEDFQLYVSLLITERFPDTKFSAIMFDYRGNRRELK